MGDTNTLLGIVLENPADDTARLVLADMLRESDDPGEQARGRFLWAGVTVARFSDEKILDDPLYYSALQEMYVVASQGFLGLWVANLLGLIPHTTGDWKGENVYGRFSARAGGISAVFSRGMLSELTLTLENWYAVGSAALTSWPLQSVAITDVPGLFFTIEVTDDGWRLISRLQLNGWRVRRSDNETANPVAIVAEGPETWQATRSLTNRGALVAGIAAMSALLVQELRMVAGVHWPSPP